MERTAGGVDNVKQPQAKKPTALESLVKKLERVRNRLANAKNALRCEIDILVGEPSEMEDTLISECSYNGLYGEIERSIDTLTTICSNIEDETARLTGRSYWQGRS